MRKLLSRRSFLYSSLLCGLTASGYLRDFPIRAPLRRPVYRAAVLDAAERATIQAHQELERFRLRVVSLNVWALPIVSKDTAARLSAIVRRLVELNVDIVGLQEVWQEEARQRIIAAARETSDLQHHYYFRAGIRESGLLILSRFPIRDVGFHRFRLTGRPERLADAEYIAGKGIGYVRVHTPAGEVDVYNTHLIAQSVSDEHDPYQAHRTAAAYKIVSFVSSQSREQNPVLVLGDLNIRPDQLGYTLVACTGGFRDSYLSVNSEDLGHTISALNPYTTNAEQKRIDYIFTKDGASVGLKTVGSWVIMDERPPVVDGKELVAYSDHYGVLSEIALFSGSSPLDASEARCRTTSAIWAEFLAYIDAAMDDAQSRQTGHYVKGLGGAVIVPGLYFVGRAMQSPASSLNASMADTVAAPPEENLEEGENTLHGIGFRRRRRFLAGLVKRIAVVVTTPYALLHGWLGLLIVPDEIHELEALRDEVRRQMRRSYG